MTVHYSQVSVPRLAELGGGNWELDGLTDITVLFGKNGSGKSVLLRAWRDTSAESAHYVTPERTGEMDFQPQYLSQELTSNGRRDASLRNYVPEYRRRIISRIQSYFLTRGDYREPGEVPASPSELEAFINRLVTDFVVELDATGNPPYVLERVEGGGRIGGVDQLSSGEAQLVTIALDILTIAAIWEIQGQANRVLLIDEPDAHIHPDLQVRFADFIMQVADRFNLQVAIATHSTSLLAALGQFGGLCTSVIYVNRRKNSFCAQPFTDMHKELSSILGGHVLMGSLFGTPILLVEGDDDYRIWSQVPRHHVTNFAVIPCNGEEIKRYQRILESIFTSLKDNACTPSGFALLDADKPLPQASDEHPQQHIRFIQLGCHEAENLYLSDEVLADLGTHWEAAAQNIVQRSSDYGEKAGLLATAATWDRKTVDLKQVINQLERILDPKPVPWTVRVGRVLGRAKPMGLLADYIGPQAIASLWPLDDADPSI